MANDTTAILAALPIAGWCVSAGRYPFLTRAWAADVSRFTAMLRLIATGWAAPMVLWRRVLRSLRRPRVLLYGGLLGLAVCTLVIGLGQRPALRVDAMRDRSVMAREVLDDAGQPQVENVYRLLVMNASAQARTVRVRATSPTAGALTVVDAAPMTLAPAEAHHLTVRLRAPLAALQAAGGTPGTAVPISLHVQDDASTDIATTPSTLWLPR